MESFKDKVISFIKSVPKGRVVSYGQVAVVAGSPRAARQVGGILRGLPDNSGVPWWRVVNSQGVISIKGNWVATKEVQKQLLEKEGVVVDNDFTLDIAKYRYNSKN